MIFLTGCGASEDDANRIGCDWFAADNCWKASAAAATLCTDGAATGTFSGDTSSCGYGDGTSIAFTNTATASWETDAPWIFTIGGAGGTCASFTETDDSLTLVTSLGTFRETWAGSTLQIACPGGERYEIGIADALSCDLATLPGSLVSESGGTLTFALLGAPPTDATLWRCAP